MFVIHGSVSLFQLLFIKSASLAFRVVDLIVYLYLIVYLSVYLRYLIVLNIKIFVYGSDRLFKLMPKCTCYACKKKLFLVRSAGVWVFFKIN